MDHYKCAVLKIAQWETVILHRRHKLFNNPSIALRLRPPELTTFDCHFIFHGTGFQRSSQLRAAATVWPLLFSVINLGVSLMKTEGRFAGSLISDVTAGGDPWHHWLRRDECEAAETSSSFLLFSCRFESSLNAPRWFWLHAEHTCELLLFQDPALRLWYFRYFTSKWAHSADRCCLHLWGEYI